MFLIVGLGNPGEQYTHTRHNVGFMVVDALEDKLDLDEAILVKPDTFMNNSGKAVKQLLQNSKFKIQNLVVIHDDVDLPFGTIRISLGHGAGGHRGVESIIKELGTKDFLRLRIGIQPKRGKPKNTDEFVLKNFTKAEMKTLEGVIEKACDATQSIITHGSQKAMNQYNT